MKGTYNKKLIKPFMREYGVYKKIKRRDAKALRHREINNTLYSFDELKNTPTTELWASSKKLLVVTFGIIKWHPTIIPVWSEGWLHIFFLFASQRLSVSAFNFFIYPILTHERLQVDYFFSFKIRNFCQKNLCVKVCSCLCVFALNFDINLF